MSKVPDPPKRPMSAFIMFFNDIRPKMIKEFPEMNVVELTKIAAYLILLHNYIVNVGEMLTG
jgi:hypothetical protein